MQLRSKSSCDTRLFFPFTLSVPALNKTGGGKGEGGGPRGRSYITDFRQQQQRQHSSVIPDIFSKLDHHLGFHFDRILSPVFGARSCLSMVLRSLSAEKQVPSEFNTRGLYNNLPPHELLTAAFDNPSKAFFSLLPHLKRRTEEEEEHSLATKARGAESKVNK